MKRTIAKSIISLLIVVTLLLSLANPVLANATGNGQIAGNATTDTAMTDATGNGQSAGNATADSTSTATTGNGQTAGNATTNSTSTDATGNTQTAGNAITDTTMTDTTGNGQAVDKATTDATSADATGSGQTAGNATADSTSTATTGNGQTAGGITADSTMTDDADNEQAEGDEATEGDETTEDSDLTDILVNKQIVCKASASVQQSASPLIVTEVMPAGPTGTRYTYTEIYNNSNIAINFKDYFFYYWYPTSLGKTWTTEGTDVYIQPGKTLVLWQNDKPEITLNDFNTYYGVNLVENVDIFRINYSGIHATAKRGFLFGQDADNIIAEAWCNENGADLTTAQRSQKVAVQYTYPGTGALSTKQEVSKATPGSVAAWQVPAEKVIYDDGNPKIASVEGDSTVAVDQPFTVKATLDGAIDGMKVDLYYKQADEFIKLEMTQVEGTKDFTASIDRSLLWSDTLAWYVEATNVAGASTKSDEKSAQIQYASIDDNKKAPFIVTEVVTPPGTGMQYSYVELYNRTNKAICYGYYNFYYEYPSGTYLTWNVSEPDIMIEPGKTLVLWLSNNGTTVAQFNEFYQTDLQENKDIVRINYGGFHSTDERTLRFGGTYDTTVVSAKFNENGADLVQGEGKSIKYTYPRMENNQCVKVSTNTKADPGTVENWQVPSSLIDFRGYEGYNADNGSSPVVTLADIIKPITEGEELFVTFNCSDTIGLTTMAINYRLDGTGGYTRLCEKKQRTSGKFFARIPSDVLFGHDYVEFYVEGFNLFRKTTTPTYKVDIKRINEVDGIRLNVSDDSVLGGTKTITANNGGDNSTTKILIDNKEFTTSPVLENGAYFAVTCDGLNSYFKNALTASYGDNSREVLSYFAPWASLNSRVVLVDNKYFTHNVDGSYDITLSMWAGDTGTPFEDIYIPSENHEDYTVTNLQLRLANGKSYLPTKIGPDNTKSNTSTAYNAVHTIGDSSGMEPRLDISFHIPAEDVTAAGYILDTTTLSDGTHTISAKSGDTVKNVSVMIDNTKPVINLGITENSVIKNNLKVNPIITDSNEIVQTSVTLDGVEVTVPYTVAARNMTEGEHTLIATAIDKAGNVSQEIGHFSTSKANLSVDAVQTQAITDNAATLSVAVSNLNGDTANVEYMGDSKLNSDNGGVIVKSGYGDVPLATMGDESSALTGDIPYQLFTINTGSVSDDALVTASWKGTASYMDDNHSIKLYVLNNTTAKWEEIGSANSSGIIEVSFAAKDHVKDGQANVLVQCRAQNSLPTTKITNANLATNTAQSSSWDGTSRPAKYDFSFAWITDTQYYVESWPFHFTQQNQWIVDNAEDWKIKYTMHTGDLVDEYDMNYQWLLADNAMKILDDAGMPNGVLAGNHDVAAGNELYKSYWKYFGEQRYADKPWYGESYNNNLGHYDLISENGQDLIILYMSWDIYKNEIDWMNKVLAQYKDRKAIICLHRYMNVKESNGTYLDYAGKVLQQNVVAKNPNVIAVLNGHYHGSAIETVGFDDNNDGVKDREVYQICTDYQSDIEGGSEYIKFLYFDLANDKIYVNSYSPSKNDYNYYDEPKLASYGEGTKINDLDIFELNVDFDSSVKTLQTESFNASVPSTVIGKVDNVTDKAEFIWNNLNSDTTYHWYAKVTGVDGSITLTPVQEFKTAALTAPLQYTIHATAGAGGVISNPGDTKVNAGDSITYTITPEGGYRVGQVLVDGQAVQLTDGKLILQNVTSDHTITVSFVLITTSTGTQDTTTTDSGTAPSTTESGTSPSTTVSGASSTTASGASHSTAANGQTTKASSGQPLTKTEAGEPAKTATSGETVKPTIPSQIQDSETGVMVDLSDVEMPDGVTSLTLKVNNLLTDDVDSDIYNNVSELLKNNSKWKDYKNVVVFDISLLNQDGQAISHFNGKIKVKIPIPDNMNGDISVLWYDSTNGAIQDMNATVEDGYIVFETDHFSYYAAVQLSENSQQVNTISHDNNNGWVLPLCLLLAAALLIGFIIKVKLSAKEDKEQ